jgi:hypothetical protein
LLASLRDANRQPHYREDLRALPDLLRTRWFLAAIGLELLGFVSIVILPSAAGILFETLTVPPAMIPIFLVGFTAPRASYLLGLIVGLVDLVLYGLYLVYAGAQTGVDVPIAAYLANGFALGVPTSIVFAAAAAWYRRFLALTNPRRQQAGRSGDRSKAKKAATARR